MGPSEPPGGTASSHPGVPFSTAPTLPFPSSGAQLSDDLRPDVFISVSAPEHIAALRAFYSVVNQGKDVEAVDVEAVWGRFQASVWSKLRERYPSRDVSKVRAGNYVQ